MLKTKDLIEKIGEEYAPMLRQVQITEFTKCIAQFSGLRMDRVSDKAIEEYLTKWAINKKRFFDLMGGNIRVDIPFIYKDEDRNYKEMFLEVGRKYPGLYPWFMILASNSKQNKIDINKIDWDARDYFNIFGRELYSFSGMALTRFFKNSLKAPDECVTDIGRIWENNEVNATFTISIDPVDMMLASENPYKWNSCYRLENDFPDSHADGCLAAILDTQSLITYVWNNEGKYNLYGNYELKSIRYKRMRMWIAISDNMTTIHFNQIYPGKGQYSDDFNKMFRNIIETFICDKLQVKNMWKSIDYNNISCDRDYLYGYNEYDYDFCWYRSDTEPEDIIVYNTPITCPCGCTWIFPGSDSEECEDYLHYNGQGFNCNNFNEEHWCEEADEYVDCDGDCENCETWRRSHAICELDTDHYCTERDLWEAEDEGDVDFSDSRIVRCNPGYCMGCPLAREHKPELFRDCIITKDDEVYARVDMEWYHKNEDNTYTWTGDSVYLHSAVSSNLLHTCELEDLFGNIINGNADDCIITFYENGIPNFMLKEEKQEEKKINPIGVTGVEVNADNTYTFNFRSGESFNVDMADLQNGVPDLITEAIRQQIMKSLEEMPTMPNCTSTEPINMFELQTQMERFINR